MIYQKTIKHPIYQFQDFSVFGKYFSFLFTNFEYQKKHTEVKKQFPKTTNTILKKRISVF
jgi:hypothetical protein